MNTIGTYQIKHELRRGGMATVYRAYDPRFGRDVAIKVLPPEFLHDLSFRARFEREAHIVAGLEHPAIVPVYDLGEDRGQPYLVMRFMAGGSLADRLSQGPLPLPEVARIMAAIAPGLDVAHQRGVVHRDLKPGNILFDEHDNPYVADFGIAKLVEGSAAYTGTAIVGTPAYMSPEQAHGNVTLDGRSDVYALGAMAYELLAGQPPYQADTPLSLAMAHILEPVPHVREAVPGLPAEVDRVLSRAMAKDREQRFATASALAAALTAAAQGHATPAPRQAGQAAGRPPSTPPRPAPTAQGARLPPPPVARRPSPWWKAWPLWIVSLALVVVLLLAVALLNVNWNGPATSSAKPAAEELAAAPGGPSTPTVAQMQPTATFVPAEMPAPTGTSTAVPTGTPSRLDTPPPSQEPVGTTLESPTPPPPPTPTTTPTIIAPTPTPVPTTPPSPTPAPTRTPLPSRPGLIADFETWGNWTRGNEAWGTFAQSQEQAAAGSSSGKFTYNFPAVPNNYLVYRRTLPIAGQPAALQIMVFGDGSGNFLNAWVQDANDQVWQFTFGQIQHTGWQKMVAPLDLSRGWPNQAVGGSASTAGPEYPLRFYALVLDGHREDAPLEGVIYVDELAAGDAAAGGAAAPAPTATSAPAPGVALSFLADRTRLATGECTTLRWDVDNVSAVFLDGQGVTGHESRQVCPAATQTYRLTITRLDGSEEQAAVTVEITAGG